jgi:hypothetical protein
MLLAATLVGEEGGSPLSSIPPAEDIASFLHVFLSAQYGSSTGALRELLADAGASVVEWASSGRAPFPDELLDVLSEVDAVVAVVDASPSSATLLEIGVAVGLEVPVVLAVAAAELVDQLPVTLRNLPVVLTSGVSNEVSQRLARTFSAIRRRSRDSTYGRSFRPSLSQSVGPDYRSVFELSVGEALVDCDLDIVPYPAIDQDLQADFGVLVPGIAGPDNVVLVNAGGPEKAAPTARAGLRRYLRAINAQIGLIVTETGGAPSWDVSEGTAIASLGLDDLRRLDRDSVLKLLADGRNRLAHAV